MKQFYRAVAWVLLIVFAAPSWAASCANPEVDWHVKDDAILAADDSVRFQGSIFGNLAKLETLQGDLSRSVGSDPFWKVSFSILPLQNGHGILVIERNFDVQQGVFESRGFVETICLLARAKGLVFHGWQANYNNQTLNGGYVMLDLEE